MRVLVVEDIAEKRNAITQVLCAALQSPAIDNASSFIAAIRLLESTSYDLLVLDLILPTRDGDHPSASGGKNVLSEIMASVSCQRPAHIICITAYEDCAPLVDDHPAKHLVHTVIYNNNNSEWINALSAKAKYAEERALQMKNRRRDHQCDVAIITSSPTVELREVLTLPAEFIGEHNHRDVIDYYHSTWKTIDARNLKVIACAAPRMGMTATCVTACKVIDTWRPRVLAMTGIAAGTRVTESYGDILVAEAAYDYGSGKIRDQGEQRRDFVPSPNPISIDADLHSVLQRIERNQMFSREIASSWGGNPPVTRAPKIILGILATGAAVVQSISVVDDIMSHSRKVVGLDMEAYAVFESARLASDPRPRVVVAKSVSDFADREKNDDFQQYAAFTSARFIYELMCRTPEVFVPVG